MADATLTNKANNISTSNAFSTGSLSWTAGARGLLFPSSSGTGGSTIAGHTATGGGVTWNEIGFVVYGVRRGISILLSDGTPATGAITITATMGSGLYEETQWSADELTNFNTTTVHDTVFTKAAASGTTMSLDDLGTIDTGDLVIAAFGFEGALDDFAPATGLTTHILRQSGSGVRSLLVGTSTTDDTPGATWTTSGNGIGGVGAIFNVAAGGAAAVAKVHQFQSLGVH